MSTVRITPKRLDLLRHIGDVSVMADGVYRCWAFGRQWKVGGDVNWLLAAKLVEENPDDADLDVRGLRRTELGDEVVAANPEES